MFPVVTLSMECKICYSSFSLAVVFRKDHEKAEFEVHEVYAVDVLISTGEGKVSVLSFLLKFITCNC